MPFIMDPAIRAKSGSHWIGGLKRSIRAYERKYEMSSDEMCKAITANPRMENSEIAIWMQKYTVVRHLSKNVGV